MQPAFVQTRISVSFAPTVDVPAFKPNHVANFIWILRALMKLDRHVVVCLSFEGERIDNDTSKKACRWMCSPVDIRSQTDQEVVWIWPLNLYTIIVVFVSGNLDCSAISKRNCRVSIYGIGPLQTVAAVWSH